MPSYFSSIEFGLAVRSGYDTAFQHEISAADFNGDGKTDVEITYFLYPLENRSVPIRVLLGDGQGGFTDGTSTLFPGGAPSTVHGRENVVGDFNGDGRADLFVADHGLDANPFPGAQNALVLSSGASGLINATAQLPQLSDYSHSAEAADIDLDGDLDIFVGNGGGGTAYVKPYFLINNGAGAFTRTDANLPSSVLNGANHWTEAFVDVDGDGDKDLFLGSSTNSGSVLLLNDGHGVFTDSGRSLPRGAANADGVEAVAFDVNGDGRQDLLVAYSVPSGSSILRQVQLLVNDGAGGFTDETSTRLPAAINTGDWSRRTLLADINGDGKIDILLSNASSAPLFLNDGRGYFVQMPAGFVPGNQYDQFQVGDFNGDGRVDVFAYRGKWDGNENFRIDLGQAIPTSQQGGASDEGFMAGAVAATILAGAGNDVIVGGAGQDFLRGEDGNDAIYGGAGFDDTHGNAGDDTVHGGLGDDWVVGGKDQDVLYGDEGIDVLLGNLGADTCYGGDDRDVVRGGQGNDIVYGGAGSDFVSGDRGDDTVYGGAGADWFHGSQDQGTDRIMDFSLAEGDCVILDPGTTYTVYQQGADTIIDTGGGNQMILVGVQLSTLPAGWIIESFAWG